MDILCKVITNILHVVGILMVCSTYLKLPQKAGDKYRCIKIFIIVIFASLIDNAIDNPTVALSIYLLWIEIIVVIYYSESIKKLSICAFMVSIVMEIIDMMFISVMNILSTLIDYHSLILEDLLAVICSVAVIYIIGSLLQKMGHDGIRSLDIKYLIMFTGILITDLIVLLLMANVTLEEQAYKHKIFYTITYGVVVIGIFIQLAAVILLLVSRNSHQEKEQIITQYLEEQVKYYEYLRDQERETKKFRHDIRGHLYFLNKLKNEGKNQEFEEYFQEMIGRVDDLGNRVHVGNDIVDAVLSKADSEAREKQIEMEITGHLPAKCNIGVYHLCTIFSNLLNNAIEAAEKTDKRKIWVICRYTQEEIIVEIGNYFNCTDRIEKTNLQTSKIDQNYHGWGMKNVRDSVEECKGLIDIEVIEDQFIVSVTLNNEKEDIQNENSDNR